jgi:hypothetical protein
VVYRTCLENKSPERDREFESHLLRTRLCYNFIVARHSFKIHWLAHEYEHKERTPDWFWAVGIIAVSVSIAAVIFGNTIFGILVLIAAFALTLFINRPPETVDVEVTEHGVRKGKVFYPYQTLRSFYIDIHHPHKKVLLRSEKTLVPLIIVPLNDDVDAERLRRTLGHFIHEEHLSLPFVEKILEYLGF